MKHAIPLRFVKKASICALLCFSLSGCAGTIIAGLTLSQLMTAGSIGSSLLTGKGLGEHALDVVTGQDCRILEAVFRKDRKVCEPKDSDATYGDFKGLVALLDTPAGAQIQLADLPLGKDQLTTIDPKARAVSGKVLAALTGKNIQIQRRSHGKDFASLSHLTKVTKKFDLEMVAALPVPQNDLRKRLISPSNR